MQQLGGIVVKLDRGFPLVRCDDGSLVRCEHAASLEKKAQVRAVIGDSVRVNLPDGHDKGVIEDIDERRTSFVRRDPAERTAHQVLAANFDLVVVAEPLVGLNYGRLERELVLAHQTGARVAVVLTKADLASDEEEALAVRDKVQGLAGRDVEVRVISVDDEASIEAVRALIGDGEVAVLIGKSGVGKSSLVNVLVGSMVQDVGTVREFDGKGRHTTVDRTMVTLPLPRLQASGRTRLRSARGRGGRRARPGAARLVSRARGRDRVRARAPRGGAPDAWRESLRPQEAVRKAQVACRVRAAGLRWLRKSARPHHSAKPGPGWDSRLSSPSIGMLGM